MIRFGIIRSPGHQKQPPEVGPPNSRSLMKISLRISIGSSLIAWRRVRSPPLQCGWRDNVVDAPVLLTGRTVPEASTAHVSEWSAIFSKKKR